MVMTRQQPFRRNTRMKGSVQDGDEDDYFNSYSERRTASSPSSAARIVSSPTVAAAAVAAAKQEEGLSLYEELLRYHRENPDEEDRLKVEKERKDIVTAEDGDRKPAARSRSNTSQDSSSGNRRKNKNGTYRIPVSREYFAAKDREGFINSPGSTSKPKLSEVSSPQQSTNPNLADWDDPRLVEGDLSHHSNRFVAPLCPEESPMPFPDTSFHDLAEDEAFARQLQAEEEERVAASRRALASNISMPPLSPMTPSSHRPSSPFSEEALARQFSELGKTHAVPATLHTSLHGTRSPRRTINRNHREYRSEGSTLETDDEVVKQDKILREIMEDNERKQLDWALEESKRAAAQQSRTRETPAGPGITDLSWQAPRSPATRRNHVQPQDSQALDWEASQRAAFEEYERQQRELLERAQRSRHDHHTTGHIDIPSLSERSQSSQSNPRSAVERGKQETANAIRSGRAHVVRCRGCAGRLQAPVHYSLVYCPKCGNVTPVE